jgi:hypothetical protein
LESVLIPTRAVTSFWSAHKAAFNAAKKDFVQSISQQDVEPHQAGSNAEQADGSTQKDQPANHSLTATPEASSGRQGNGTHQASFPLKVSWMMLSNAYLHMRTIARINQAQQLHEIRNNRQRGHITLTGTVGVPCAKGRLWLDVEASYGPLCDSFHFRSIVLRGPELHNVESASRD